MGVGPEWLSLDTPILPDFESTPMPELCLSELKVSSKLTHNLLAIEMRPNTEGVMTCADFRSILKLLRVTAYVLRAVSYLKAKKSDLNHPTTLTTQEILLQRSYGSTIHRSWFSRGL